MTKSSLAACWSSCLAYDTIEPAPVVLFMFERGINLRPEEFVRLTAKVGLAEISSDICLVRGGGTGFSPILKL